MIITREQMAALVKRSVLDPRGAARQIMDLRLTSDVLWTAVLLVVILSVLFTHGTLLIAGQQVSIVAFMGSPLVFAVFMAGQMVLLIFALFWTGKALGGSGALEQFVGLMAWLQALWLIAQLVQTVLLLFAPALAALFGYAAILYGLWILIHFISEAHGFPTWHKGAGVLALSFVGVVIGLSLLLAVVGVSTLGLQDYV